MRCFNSSWKRIIRYLKKAFGLVRRILDYAAEQRLISWNPAKSKSIQLTGTASRVTKPYTVEQMRYLIAHIADVKLPSDRNWLVLITSNVLRPEEALGFKWQDLDREHGLITVQRAVTHPTRNQPVIKDTKTKGSVRTLCISPVTLAHLSETEGEWIVGGEKPLSQMQVKRMCNRIVKETGADFPITPERFRTTVATDLYDQTGDLKLLQAAGGWTTAAVPLKYYAKGRATTEAATAAIHSVYGLGNEAM